MKKSIVALLHLCYWMMYLFLVTMLLAALNHGKLPMRQYLFYSPAGIAAFVPAIIGFYSFYGILFRKYLAQKKIPNLCVSVVLIVIISPAITETILYSCFNRKIDGGFNTIFYAGLIISFITLVNGILGLVMKGFITWYDDIKLKAELNKKNYEMELALMKAQVNPHFLFNTLNNIDVLIQKDPIKASEYLNKLSDIMRFMIYETKTEKISLTKELEYITKYVELQKIRTSNPSYIKYTVEGDSNNILIEPMLFIPFIENAFKHAENKKVENAINVTMIIEKNKIKFECENSYALESHSKPEYGGLGNELIQKRLAILYPNKHSFEIINKNGIYKINLVLSL